MPMKNPTTAAGGPPPLIDWCELYVNYVHIRYTFR